MRKIFTLAFFLAFTLALTAQAPQSFQYQTIIRDAQGEVVANQNVSLRMTIFQGANTEVYQETHGLSTNAFGLVNLEIGEGTTGGTLNDFTAIDWSTGDYHVQVELDLSGTGSSYTVMGTTKLQSVPYALYAETSGPTYKVGDFAQGGVVFYVDASGEHGLVADIEDLGSFTWGNQNEVTGATGDGVGAGEMNTAFIVATNPDLNSAAKVCADLNKGGYGDWYLPSKGELNLMFQNKATINATAGANGGSEFANDFYWSSTEFVFDVNDVPAWNQFFGQGGQGFNNKLNSNRVRAVRAF
jgi:hypothetical protein